MFDQQIIFFVLLFGVVALGAFFAIRLLTGKGDGRLRDRLRHAAAPSAAIKPEGPGFASVLNRIGQAAAKPFEPKTREKQSEVRRKLVRAGIYSPAIARVISGAKVILLFAGIGGGLLAGTMLGDGPMSILLGLSFGGILGYMVPFIWLKMQIGKQQKALDRGLADAVDLLVVCVEAGLTIDSAMQRVGQEIAMAHAPLAKEFEITHMETRVGLARSEALRNLGTRTGNAALASLASMLIQAERFGTSIASALRIHADSLRQTRKHAAEEMAAKATVKLSFPVVLFIFPAVLIVLAGPAVIGLFNSALFN